jgi:hypothetical protein
LQGAPPAAWQSQFRGVCWKMPARFTRQHVMKDESSFDMCGYRMYRQVICVSPYTNTDELFVQQSVLAL